MHSRSACLSVCLWYSATRQLFITPGILYYSISYYFFQIQEDYILVKVPCECITGNIARGRGREPIKHVAQPSALFARDHAPSAIFSLMHGRERYFNWFIVAEFLASAALNDSK